MARVFGSPSRYLQGPGVLDTMGAWLGQPRGPVVLVADAQVLELIGERVARVCAAGGMPLHALEFSGEIIPEEVGRLTALARAHCPALVIGAGGGKGIDAGKGVAHALELPVVTIPTAASNDAPTSKNYVLYDRAHRLLRVEHMPANPVLVVVDTEVIVTAPPVLFSAGIGDALVKKFEVDQCVGSGGRNMFGASPCGAAQALAERCYRVLRASAVDALASVRLRRVSDAVEEVVEATVLLSGLGFESGGLSIAHAMTRGLSQVPGARDALHGHQVAYALLVQLVLERRERAFLEDMLAFHRAVALPVRLGDMGLAAPTPEQVALIAAGTMTAPHVRNFDRALGAGDIAAAIEAVEHLGWRAL